MYIITKATKFRFFPPVNSCCVMYDFYYHFRVRKLSSILFQCAEMMRPSAAVGKRILIFTGKLSLLLRFWWTTIFSLQRNLQYKHLHPKYVVNKWQCIPEWMLSKDSQLQRNANWQIIRSIFRTVGQAIRSNTETTRHLSIVRRKTNSENKSAT